MVRHNRKVVLRYRLLRLLYRIQQDSECSRIRRRVAHSCCSLKRCKRNLRLHCCSAPAGTLCIASHPNNRHTYLRDKRYILVRCSLAICDKCPSDSPTSELGLALCCVKSGLRLEGGLAARYELGQGLSLGLG